MDSSRFKFWFNFSDGVRRRCPLCLLLHTKLTTLTFEQDKDMFRFAFLALRKRWGLPGRYVAVGALPRNSMSGFCGHTMLQHDHLGRPLFVHANLLKQIPSGVGKGYAWGKSRSLHSSPNSMQLPQEADKDVPEVYIDHDVDCDMLANAANDGVAISPAPPAVRRRAVLEKGLRPFFHVSGEETLSALLARARTDHLSVRREVGSAHSALICDGRILVQVPRFIGHDSPLQEQTIKATLTTSTFLTPFQAMVSRSSSMIL